MASRFLTPYSSSRSNWLPEPLFQLQREIDRVFDDVFSGGGGGRSAGTSLMNAPRIDLQEAEGELRLHADLPGIQPSDLDIRVDGDVLTIRGERKHESDRNEQNFHVMERSHGRFQRSIQLPFAPNPEEVRAEVRHGVLEIRIPKRAPEQRSRRIEVRGESQGSGGQAIGGESGSAMAHAVAGGGSAGGRDSATSGEREPSRSGSAEQGNVGQGPGGSNSATPGVGGGAQGSERGLAGVAGGATSAPVGESSSSSSSSPSPRR